MALDSSEKVRIYQLNGPVPTELQPVVNSGNIIATNFTNEIIALNYLYEALFLETCNLPDGKPATVKRNILRSLKQDGFSLSLFANQDEFSPGTAVYVPISLEANGHPKSQLTIVDYTWMPSSHFIQTAIETLNAKQNYDESVAQIKKEFSPKKMTYHISSHIPKEKLSIAEKICQEYIQTAQAHQDAVHKLGMLDAAIEIQRMPHLSSEVEQSYLNGRECQRRLSKLITPPTLEQKLFP